MAQPKKVDNDARLVFVGLNGQRSVGKFCDIILISGGQRFPAHRCVLAANSPYFDTMFTGNFSEKESAEIDLTESDKGAVLGLLIDFFYLGSIVITKSNAHSLLAISDLLMMTKVKHVCANFLQSVLSPGNCLEIWTIATEHSCQDLENKAFDYAQKSFYYAIAACEEDFLELTVGQLMELLNGDQLTARSEESICQAAFSWIGHQPDDRKKHLRNILASIRLMQCDRKFLVETLTADGLVQENEECRRLVDVAIDQLLIFDTSKVDAQLKPTDGQRSVAYKKDTLYAIGGYNEDDTGLNTVERYDALSNSFDNVAPMLIGRYGFGAVTIDEQIFVMGGCSDYFTSLVHRYDPISDRWSAVTPMSTIRQDFGVAVLHGQVYAVGGKLASGQRSKLLDRYDPQSDSWTSMAPMAGGARSDCTAVALNNCLYVLGGTVYGGDDDDTGEVVDTVEVFDPSTGVWSPSVPMPMGRWAFGCAVFGGKIFVAGGWTTHEDDLSSVVCFDPTDQQWRDCGDLCSTRAALSLAVVDDRLLAIGGCDAHDGVPSVEEYVPATNTWRHLVDMIEARYFHCVAVI